ncbi:hypothetical protein CBL_00297 [Carabus blaptoides fortunei]
MFYTHLQIQGDTGGARFPGVWAMAVKSSVRLDYSVGHCMVVNTSAPSYTAPATSVFCFTAPQALWLTADALFLFRGLLASIKTIDKADGTVEINPGNLINARFEKAGTGCRNALCYCKGLVSLTGKVDFGILAYDPYAFPTRFYLKLLAKYNYKYP